MNCSSGTYVTHNHNHNSSYYMHVTHNHNRNFSYYMHVTDNHNHNSSYYMHVTDNHNQWCNQEFKLGVLNFLGQSPPLPSFPLPSILLPPPTALDITYPLPLTLKQVVWGPP